MAGPKALLFDVFGTLVDWRGTVARLAEAEFGPSPPVTGKTWFDFADAWRARYQPAMEEIRTGRRAFTVLDVLHRENLVAVLPAFGLADVDSEIRDRITLFWHRLDPWPDTSEGLRRMRSRYDLAAHSNGNIALISSLSRHAHLPFTHILGAEAVGYYKPRPESYLRAAERLSLPPRQCMMVAAHNTDLAAARDCGLMTAFIPRPTEYGPGQTSDLVPTGPWDVVGKDMIDLAGRLAC